MTSPRVCVSETSRLEISRRAALGGGTASLLAALLAGEGLAAGADGGATVQLYEKIEPQKYPWGWIRWLMNARIDPQAEMTLGLVRVEAHQSNPRHVHANSAEFLHVISGTCQQHIGDRWVSMKTGDTVSHSAGRAPLRPHRRPAPAGRDRLQHGHAADEGGGIGDRGQESRRTGEQGKGDRLQGAQRIFIRG